MTNRTPFIEQVEDRWQRCQSLLCIGLDPEPARLPETYHRRDLARGDGLLAFCVDIVDPTAPLVCAFTPQFAYFAAQGKEDDLAGLIHYIHARYPDIPVILDAKRGDIGSTAKMYAMEAFERYDADAVTVNPYLGRESLEPYLAYTDRGTILLCRTSNVGSDWLQNYPESDPVYLQVARAATRWNEHRNVMLVAGATHIDELRRIRETVGDMPLLVPGIGAQGGDLRAVLTHGADAHGQGLLINSSRSILYADAENPRDGAWTVAAALLDDIRRLQGEVTPHRAMV